MSLTARAIRALKRTGFYDRYHELNPVVYDFQEVADSFPDIKEPKKTPNQTLNCLNEALVPVIDEYNRIQKLPRDDYAIVMPHPCVSLEFEISQGPKQIIIAYHGSDGPIYVDAILYDPESLNFRPSCLTGATDFRDHGVFLNEYGMSRYKGMIEQADKIHGDLIDNSIFSVKFLCIALSLFVVKAPVTCQGATNAQNEKRARKNKQRLLQERKVTIYVPRETYAPTEHQGGTHASPCPHMRAGHWRRLKSGRQTWIRQCQVGKGPIPETTYEIRTRH